MGILNVVDMLRKQNLGHLPHIEIAEGIFFLIFCYSESLDQSLKTLQE
jgi:hypothetical protein